MAKTIAVDIGHGTDTSGKGVSRGSTYYAEHSFNSDVGLQLKAELERHGFNVWLPQPANAKEVGLTERTNEANRKDVDLYWSIHANAGGASGVCAFYWHTSSAARKLAEDFAKEMRAAGFSTHGSGTHASKRGSWTNLHVCRETSMPAVLTENGFMDNAADFEGIFGSKRKEYRQRVAQTHAKVICEYFGVVYKPKETEEGEYMELSGNRHDRQVAILEELAEKGIIHEKHAKEMKAGEWRKSDAIYVLYEIYARELLK
ncbi:N-acetylmuramoyl-L-alanine amidase family protein [Salibacterium aidingense]|uniref:N-acetylmuramoyl-L-alanine amidase family protein n=1 Tax=Salibacterium aidingense TaxID=384933 RepID=UPI003BBF9BA4